MLESLQLFLYEDGGTRRDKRNVSSLKLLCKTQCIEWQE